MVPFIDNPKSPSTVSFQSFTLALDREFSFETLCNAAEKLQADLKKFSESNFTNGEELGMTIIG